MENQCSRSVWDLEMVRKIKLAFQGLEMVGDLCAWQLRSCNGGEIHQGDEKQNVYGDLGTRLMR
jgi:hypothetical protein